MDNDRITLSLSEQIGFGMGHVLNDIHASFWFAYTLIFYQLAVGPAGFILCIFCQAVDCVNTLTVGFVFDLECGQPRFFKQGKYTAWYMIGFVMVILSFCHCFLELPFMVENQAVKFWIYMIAGLFAYIGWTFIQIAHLTMVNTLSVTNADRVRLTTLRQGGSIYAAIVVFAYFWYTLSADSETHVLGIEDTKIFAISVFWLTNFGALHSLAFLYMVDEPKLTNRKKAILDEHASLRSSMNLKAERKMDQYTRIDWLLSPVFYIVMIVFTFSRLYQTLLFTYVPLYLQFYLFLTKVSSSMFALTNGQFCLPFVYIGRKPSQSFH